MKIVLTHGFFLCEDKVEQKIMKPYPPLGILYLSSWLKQEGIANEVYDTTFKKLEEMTAWLELNKPEIVGIYSTLMTKMNVLKIMTFIRSSVNLSNTKIIIGGPDVRHNSANYLNSGADIVIPGEGEQSFTETANALLSNQQAKLSKIPGIIYKNNEGKIILNESRGLIDPDLLPNPLREKIDISEYRKSWIEKHGFFSLTISSMRGCPYSCNWCSKPVFGNTYRRRSAKLVVEEMLLLKNQYNPDQVWFTDDVFTINREWLREFYQEVIKNSLVLPFECITRADCMDEEIIVLLKRSGCRKVWIGAESGSQRILDRMNRKTDIRKVKSLIMQIKSAGMESGTFIMLGYPGEEKSDIMETSCFLRQALPDEYTIGMAYPIKGTKFYDEAKPAFAEPFNWETQTERQIRFNKPYSDRFYKFAIRYIFNSVESAKASWSGRKAIFLFKASISGMIMSLSNR